MQKDYISFLESEHRWDRNNIDFLNPVTLMQNSEFHHVSFILYYNVFGLFI